jgi:hypothetical protein
VSNRAWYSSLARRPLDGDITLVVIKDRQTDRKCRARRINRCRVVRVVGCDIEFWKLLDDRLPQLLLLRLVAGHKGEEIGSPPGQIFQNGCQFRGVDRRNRHYIGQAELHFGRETEQRVQVVSIFQDHLLDIVQLGLDGLQGGQIAHDRRKYFVPLLHRGVGALIAISEQLSILIDQRALTVELDGSHEEGAGLADDLPLLPQEVQTNASLICRGGTPAGRSRQQRHYVLAERCARRTGGRPHPGDQHSVGDRELRTPTCPRIAFRSGLLTTAIIATSSMSSGRDGSNGWEPSSGSGSSDGEILSEAISESRSGRSSSGTGS